MTSSPFDLFKSWFDEAQANEDSYPDAFSLATADSQGWPAVRTLLLKQCTPEAFVFFTNYQSHKAQDLIENPKAEMLFYWKSIKKQIRIRGEVCKASSQVSDAYWESRDYVSRLNSFLSQQSSEKPDSFDYQKEISKLKQDHPEAVPRPQNWGGFVLKASYFEFWQEGDHRWHQRFSLEKTSSGTWKKTNLFP